MKRNLSSKKQIVSQNIIFLAAFLFNLFSIASLGQLGIDLFHKVYEKHICLLRNTELDKKARVICFSGTPGMGKSFISKALEERYNAVRLVSDHLRDIVESLNIAPDVRDVKGERSFMEAYLAYFFERGLPANKLIILDASIDRYYKTLFEVFHKLQIPFIVIRLQVSPIKVAERILQRNGAERAEWFFKHMPRWREDYDNFAITWPNSCLFSNELDDSPLLPVFEAIDAFLI